MSLNNIADMNLRMDPIPMPLHTPGSEPTIGLPLKTSGIITSRPGRDSASESQMARHAIRVGAVLDAIARLAGMQPRSQPPELCAAHTTARDRAIRVVVVALQHAVVPHVDRHGEARVVMEWGDDSVVSSVPRGRAALGWPAHTKLEVD